MTENQNPSNEANNVDQPVMAEPDQELDEESLDQVSGGTPAGQVVKFFQLMSNVEKSRSDTAKQIAGNIR